MRVVHAPGRRGEDIIHIYQGDCPDDIDPTRRDPDCPACQALSLTDDVAAAARAQALEDAALACDKRAAEWLGWTEPEAEAQACAAAIRALKEKT